MGDAAAHGRLTLARPLLGLRKAELIAFCEACGEPFARDPSNEDSRFARTHLRRLTGLLAAEGLGVDEIARLSRRAGRMEDAVVAQTKATAERLGWASAVATRDGEALLGEPPEIVQRLLAAEIARVGGKPARQIRLEAVEALTQGLRQARAQNKALRANVGGVSVRLSAKGTLSLGPETPRRGRPKGEA